MIKMIVAHSYQVDSETAIADLLNQAQAQLDGAKPAAALLFSALQLNYSRLLGEISAIWPKLPLIGCTTDGELSSRCGFGEDSVTLTLFVSDQIRFSAGLGRAISEDPQAACETALSEARKGLGGQQPKLCLVTPESLTTSVQQLLGLLQENLSDSVPILGGVAADYWQFQGTHQFFGTEVLSDSLPLLLWSGPMLLSFGVASGWTPIGAPGIVTRAEGNRVYAIDHEPAINYYRRFLGKYAQPTGDRPLAMLDNAGNVVGLRAPTAGPDEDGSVPFFADVPQDISVQLTVADRDGILEGSRQSIQAATANYPEGHKPDMALIFSCSGRKFLLGSRVIEEAQIISDELQGIPYSGFYGYGEIGPISTAATLSRFHNETFVSLLIGTPNSSTTAQDDNDTPRKATQQPADDALQDRDILAVRLARSQRHRLLLEELKEQSDSLHRHVINELEDSKRIILESIQYASRIQRAILPDISFFQQLFQDHFILWEPRDVVGGDIYWHRNWGEGNLLVLGDCTGHGIPGAFMTMIINGALDRALQSIEVGETGQLLTHMNRIVQKVLKQDRAEGESNDGMELGVLYFPPELDHTGIHRHPVPPVHQQRRRY